jgi:hypothetical protein
MRFITLVSATAFVIGWALPVRASVVDTEITDEIRVYVPLAPCAVPTVASRIMELTGTPGGIEGVPGCATREPKPAPDGEWISLLGLTEREALDRLVALDRRYHWIETDGIVVVRPLDAWKDPRHFMNATFSGLTLTDQHLGCAVNALAAMLRGDAFTPVPCDWDYSRTEQEGRRFSVSLPTASILDAANAFVRAHGSMRWTLSYCKPEQRREYATLMLSTFDRAGLGVGPTPVRDETGRHFSACGDTRKRR